MRILILGLVCLGGILAVLYLAGIAMTARVETVEWSAATPLPGAKFIDTKLGRSHYIDVGDGPPVLLLHGSGDSLAAWQEGTIERLAKRHRVIAFDFFGNGFSERNPAFIYGYDLWVAQAVELLDALKISRVTVVGHSVGGALACVMAADHPARVDHVVTIGTGLTIEPQQLLPLVPGIGEIILANRVTYGGPYPARHLNALKAAFEVKGTRAAFLAYARRQAAIDGLRLVTGTFEDIKAPVLHISGTRDVNIAPEIAKALVARTGGTFVPIDGAAHDVHIDAPDRLVEEIELFLSRSTSTRRHN